MTEKVSHTIAIPTVSIVTMVSAIRMFI